MSNQDTLIHKGNLITLNREKVELRVGGYTHFDIVKHRQASWWRGNCSLKRQQ